MATYTDTGARHAACSLLLALLAATCVVPAHADDPPAPPEAAPASAPAATVVITGRALGAGVAGFGATPVDRLPLQAAVVDQAQLREGGGTGLAALTRFDAAVSDAYNAEGYWSGFTVRGFAIDNRYNFMRDGLPINAETSLPLDNKSAVEILEGTSGAQAGTSAPGGLVNLVVKRPDGKLRAAGAGWRQDGTFGSWVDLSQRFGADDAFGLRLNLAAEHLDPLERNAKGQRRLFALAGDWRAGSGTLLEAEVETSRQSQPSVPGFSLLGSVLPAPSSIDPRVNLNNQPWSLPVVLEGTTASLRWTQQLWAGWKLQAHGATQHLHSDDRLAFSFGCSKEGNYDRYCSDGTFDYYDFRSDAERRVAGALDLHLQGRAQTGPLGHQLTFGALATRFRLRTQPQADYGEIVGSGSVDGQTIVASLPPDLGLIPNSLRTERSTEIYARDRVQLTPDAGVWLGLRHTRIERASAQTDGSQATDYAQSFTIPWIAVTQALGGDRLLYASWGQGVESAVTPNLPGYLHPGQPLPAVKSRQFEIGIKQRGDELAWGVAGFDIRRPLFDDVDSGCGGAAPCLTTQLDGQVHNRGIEASLRWAYGALTLNASTMALRAVVDGNSNPDIDGKRPTNVPARTLKLDASYAVPALPGLTLRSGMVFEGQRMVLPDNSLQIPGWTRWDLAARYRTRADSTTLTWLLGVDNAARRRAWRESPYQYQHVYLFPLSPRTWRVSVQGDF